MSTRPLSQRVEALVRPEIRALSAYHVPPAAGLLKLDAMENPYQWPDPLKRQWLDTLNEVSINRYPEPGAEAVKAGLRQVMGVADDYEVLLGNGSDEIIQLLALAVTAPGRSILAPEPSFVMYRMIGTFVGMEYIGVPLGDNFELDLEAMLAAVKTHQPALIFLAQPNNPTGNLFEEAKVRAIIEAADGLVVLDEAYTAFTDTDSLPLLDEYDNLVVMRTLSKVGLAGLRLGLLIGKPEWLGELDKLRLPYNINVLTQASAVFALQHFDVLKAQTRQLRQDRELMVEMLRQIPALAVWPSEANFVLVRTPAGRARDIFEALKLRGILIKVLDGSHPALADCLRLTVGSSAENARLLEELAAILDS
ncbi:histidinol-phosphate transaminase [Motiliproteus sediminis]|uniref:histidinol-phosphate transaminase n=1 Tax=Motiliproteus sediminis TaxID=1468178 RepID=UPI001AEFFA2F|nr:histidinol-phosphate transaminase [Motiliproteus sediminis]